MLPTPAQVVTTLATPVSAPELASSSLALTKEAVEKPDVLDKSVTFLAKRDGIDKVGLWEVHGHQCQAKLKNARRLFRIGAGAQDYALHSQVPIGICPEGIKERFYPALKGI